MTHTLRIPRFIFVVLFLIGFVANARADTWHDDFQTFAKAHCLDCHGGPGAEADLDLTKLGTDLEDAEVMRRWTLIHDRIAANEMPPKDEARPKPTAKTNTLAALAKALTDASEKRNDVVLRRLNRNEYENTVRDLFGVFVNVKQVLPNDTPTDGFDNVGEGLAFSAEAARAYLRAADVTLDAAFGTPKKPKYIVHHTNLLKQTTHDGKIRINTNMFRKTKDGLVIFQSGYCPTNLVNFARLRASPGTYRGTFKVRAIQSKEPVTLRIYGGDTIVGRREKHLVGYFDVPPDKWTTIKFEDRLVEGGGTFQPKCYGTRDTRKNADTYPEPGIEISDITIEGPLEPWPPPSRAKLLGDVDPRKGTFEDAKRILARVLPRAFRREIKPDELTPYVGLVKSALDKGRSFESTLRLGLKAVLCSPEFLYLDEPGRDKVGPSALASRLSYFLWSSMPDDTLLSLAKNGTLAKPDVLRKQVERMLADPKAKAFTINFVGQWLDLRDIDFTTPDKNLYPDFDELLQLSMVEETHRFFREILDRDLSVTNFIDSDFTFLNERLARHYSIPGVKGHAKWQKVKLPPESVRGGVLTQASVLKVTANGTTTSPVLRGAWVMENILGKPVPPPPANVPAVEPDIRGATTLREQLVKHRNVQSCAVCHNKIDPPGFALENFDVIGGWRTRYRSLGKGDRPKFGRDPITHAWIRYRLGPPVDASGQMLTGERFDDIRKFKKLLLADKRAVAKGLTEKLLTYGLGRRLGFADRDAVEGIVTNVAKQNYGLRTLVHEIVQSKLYQKP